MDELNKEELIVEARMRGVQTDDSWTAARILAAVKEKQCQQVHYSLHCPQVMNISSEIKAFQVAKHVMELTTVVQWLSYSPLDPRFAGLIPAGVDGFFRL